MDAYLYFNQDARMDRDYQPGDSLRRSMIDWSVDHALTSQEQAAQVFRKANMDYRPNGDTERSACVGDIILLPDGTIFSVAGQGFTLHRKGTRYRV